MVTPAQANGRMFGDPAPFNLAYDMFPVEPISPFGDSLVFETEGGPFRSPTGGNGRINGDVWEARRDTTGWQVVRHVTPTGAEALAPNPGGISADHGYNFVFVERYPARTGTNGSLAAEGEADYLGDPSGNYELTGIGSLGTERLAQGRYISPGGEHVIFSTGRSVEESEWCRAYQAPPKFICPVAKLEPDAPLAGTGAIYDRAADGTTHVVSLLPGNVTPTAGQNAIYQGVSTDGSAVAFKIGNPLEGTLYLRVDNAETKEVATGATTFGGASAEGTYLFFLSGVSLADQHHGDIYRFNVETGEDEEVNSSGDAKMVNVSADGSHVYFISPSQLDGSQGSAGAPNLYVWAGGSPEFIATVDPADTTATVALSNWTNEAVGRSAGVTRGPGNDASRTTPDGSVIIFESRAQLTPYENSGHTEIYRYDVEGKSLKCVSCNPGGMPASADARLQSQSSLVPTTVIHNLSADGGRVFFETSEALVGSDNDEVNDVYEWQETPGGPELSLISSGNATEFAQLSNITPIPNILMGVSGDGSDVFFRSLEPLVPGAPLGGSPSIYDARVDGGFPAPPLPPAPCSDLSSCRAGEPSPPALEKAGSLGLAGSGNVKPKPRKHRRCKHPRHRRRAHSCQRHKRAVASQTLSVAQQESAPSGRVVEAAQSATPSDQEPGAEGTAVPRSLAPRAFAAEFEDFRIESLTAEISTEQAARHPDFTTDVVLSPLKTEVDPRTEDLVFNLPPGFYGNPNLLRRCRTGDLLGGDCPVDSQIGLVRIKLFKRPKFATVPLFNMALPHPDREVARFGLMVATFPIYIDVSVDTAGDYGISAGVHGANGIEAIEAAETTIWGDPPDHSHDEQRLTIQESLPCDGTACGAPGGERASTLEPFAFLTNPSACGPLEVGVNVTSYQLPGQVFSKSAPMDPIADCEGLPFAPTFEATPTSRVAGAPTGLQTILKIPQSSNPTKPSTATMREAKVTLPQGMTIAAGAADGLEVCSEAQVHFHEELDAQCPDASKLGTATIASPALPEPLQGAVYQRSPAPGHLFRFWLVTDRLGLHVKLPAEIEPDPHSGQLTTVLQDLPPVPVEEVTLDIFGGDRAPLKNPDACGTYDTAYSFAPDSNDPPVTGQAPLTIDEGCGPRGFSPKLSGGTTNPTAGAYSPLVLDLIREDGEQNLAGFEATMPDGLLAKLKGVPLCPEATAPSGACPAGSKIGHLSASAGPGPDPLWIPQPGKDPTAVYLAGPYKGAPYSAVAVVPAQVGPFDLGDVVSRSALRLDPESAKVTVATDPLPQIIEGVPISYRHLHVVVDRPEFVLNPTDCSELAITSSVSSTEGTLAHPSARFEVDGCKALKFAPKLTLRLKGGTERGDYPALSATLKARKGDANLGSVSVALPHSEFLAQEHIVTICTRKQFAVHKCPKGSVYGRAKAFSPLLDEPLVGPVYLRSSDNPLPDLVMDLRGQIEVAVVGRIDSKNGGIRPTFDAIPDAPISKFTVRMRGGKKSLLVNSTDICQGSHRATVRMGAQNGRRLSARPPLRAKCRS
jgi:hypothetical protein